ncbi:MAG: AsmA family protein [Rubrivivax sp.]|nr:AsmA family protein [Rubrivivax sp.]
MPTPPARPWRRWALALPLVLLAAFALGEAAGWAFLRAPLENTLGSRLGRPVALAPDGGAFSLRVLGGLRVQASRLVIGAPDWSKAPHLLDGQDVSLELGWGALWDAWHDETGTTALRVRRLDATRLDVHAERADDGRASWQFGPAPSASSPAPAPLPQFGRLGVADGTLHYTDAAQGTAVEAKLTLAEGNAPDAAAPRFTLSAGGRFQRQPLKLELQSGGLLPFVPDEDTPEAVALKLKATLGRATLAFDGTTTGLLEGGGLNGHFKLQGPSLAAVGDPLRVTLPTTAPFIAEGELQRRGTTWLAQVADATIGRSRVRGTFAYRSGPGQPLLTGQLSGPRLLLADLGPAVGTPVDGAAKRGGGKVLPTRPFDLAALRVMDADVRIALDELNLDTPKLEPLRPMRAHLLLNDGVLELKELDARTAQGSLKGGLSLDGRGEAALWKADVRWAGVLLQQWLRLARKEGEPPWVTGKLNGSAVLQGQGRSTAEILASLQGSVRTSLGGGTLSHLAVEAAGLDLAQTLGVMISGDESLPVNCAVADLEAKAGVLRPRTLVVDATDSVLWMDGTLSLATETMDLRVVVAPRDFSPLALRTPLRVSGPISAPAVTLARNPLTGKVGAALLLALINPLAALLPMLDPGNTEGADSHAAGCQALAARIAARR